LLERPTNNDLIAVATFAERFDAPGFSAGEWVPSEKQKDGSYTFPWWRASPAVSEWHRALYDHGIVDPDSGYLDESNVEFVRRLNDEPSLIANSDLPTVRRVLTYLARGEHFDAGTFAEAFKSGLAQAATRRLGNSPSSKVIIESCHLPPIWKAGLLTILDGLCRISHEDM